MTPEEKEAKILHRNKMTALAVAHFMKYLDSIDKKEIKV